MTIKTRNEKSVAGRIVFSYNAKVIDVIDLDEASLKPERKVKIVEDKLSEMVRKKVIKGSERFNVSIVTEWFPPSTFLSSTQLRPVDST